MAQKAGTIYSPAKKIKHRTSIGCGPNSRTTNKRRAQQSKRRSNRGQGRS